MTPASPILDAYFRLPIAIVRGSGCYLFDKSGKSYLDFAAGVAVTGLGHCHPEIVAALQAQAETLWQCSNLFEIPEQQRFASRLVEQSFADKVFFCSSGLEAVETAIKLMRKYHYRRNQAQRNRIITLKGGFHGRSLACLSAGGNEHAREGFRPLLEGFDAVERNDITALERAITEETAGILLEPIQAEGGIYPLDAEYLRMVRALADQHGILLCFDEVQCGYGRSGYFFAHQEIGVMPDILTAAKGIGNGFPLAAVLCTEAVASAITPGTHGSTYGGNPLAMAVGNAVLDVMQRPGFFEHVRSVAAYLESKLNTLKAQFPASIVAIRGKGLLQGIEVNQDVTPILRSLAQEGLLVTRAGGNRVLRLVPPLIITQAEVDEATQILVKVFGKLA